MRIRVVDEDPSKFVIYTEDMTAARLDNAAKIAKDISDGFNSLASVALDINAKEYPMDKFVEVVRKMRVLKNLDLGLQIPRELLGILSSATPPSEFFGSLYSAISSEKHALDAKKKLFSTFLQHLDSV